jgi:hypothetical protein
MSEGARLERPRSFDAKLGDFEGILTGGEGGEDV